MKETNASVVTVEKETSGVKRVPSRLGTNLEDYERFGIRPGEIQQWEDGRRTDGFPGDYEWWYFDANLDDGAKLVVVFQTKELAEINKPLTPTIRIDLTLPDGTQHDKLVELDPATFSASKERCDVRIGENTFNGDLHTYTIHAKVDEIEVDVKLTGQVPAWRPASGHFLFGEKGEDIFAWLPSVPQGKVTATYRVGGDRHITTGVGYHDHNWGNAPMLKLMHHWYWARGASGPYSVISSYITAEKKYGYTEHPIFMLTRDGKVIADDSAKVLFEELGRYIDQRTGKPVGNVTRYTYTDGNEKYVVTYTRHRDTTTMKFLDEVKGPKKLAARLLGFDGAYLRFTGELRIEHYRGDMLLDGHADPALWELMYFGHARP
jgi:CrtC N-terminal lipocalin domain